MVFAKIEFKVESVKHDTTIVVVRGVNRTADSAIERLLDSRKKLESNKVKLPLFNHFEGIVPTILKDEKTYSIVFPGENSFFVSYVSLFISVELKLNATKMVFGDLNESPLPKSSELNTDLLFCETEQDWAHLFKMCEYIDFIFAQFKANDCILLILLEQKEILSNFEPTSDDSLDTLVSKLKLIQELYAKVEVMHNDDLLCDCPKCISRFLREKNLSGTGAILTKIRGRKDILDTFQYCESQLIETIFGKSTDLAFLCRLIRTGILPMHYSKLRKLASGFVELKTLHGIFNEKPTLVVDLIDAATCENELLSIARCIETKKHFKLFLEKSDQLGTSFKTTYKALGPKFRRKFKEAKQTRTHEQPTTTKVVTQTKAERIDQALSSENPEKLFTVWGELNESSKQLCTQKLVELMQQSNEYGLHYWLKLLSSQNSEIQTIMAQAIYENFWSEEVCVAIYPYAMPELKQSIVKYFVEHKSTDIHHLQNLLSKTENKHLVELFENQILGLLVPFEADLVTLRDQESKYEFLPHIESMFAKYNSKPEYFFEHYADFTDKCNEKKRLKKRLREYCDSFLSTLDNEGLVVQFSTGTLKQQSLIRRHLEKKQLKGALPFEVGQELLAIAELTPGAEKLAEFAIKLCLIKAFDGLLSNEQKIERALWFQSNPEYWRQIGPDGQELLDGKLNFWYNKVGRKN